MPEPVGPRVIGLWHAAQPRLNWRRQLRASLRDFLVLLRQFRLTLFAFAMLMLVGTVSFVALYRYPDAGQRLDWDGALYAVFALVFFQLTLPLPENVWLEALYFIIPIVGLSVLANGVVRFGVMLFNKHARKEEWQVALASTYRNHVIVCGLGKVGYRVARQLLDFGEEVVGIERDPNGSFVNLLRQMDIPVIIADARQREVLQQAGIEHASALVTCTEHDLTNLDIALDARELNPAVKVVMRMFDADLARKVERGFGIHTVFSVSALAAPAFAAAATRANVSYSFYMDNTLLNVSQVTIEPGSSLVGKTVGQVERELDLTIVQYKSTTKLDLHPDPNLVLQGGDHIAVFAELATLGKLNALAKRK